MEAPHFSWGRKGPLSLLVTALALVALTPAPAAAQQRVSETASKSAGNCWPAGWVAGAVAFGTGYNSPSGSQRVREVQRRLKRAGARPGPVDGLFGPLTRAAVKRFQRRHDIAPSGVVGLRTLTLLQSRTVRDNEQSRVDTRRQDEQSRVDDRRSERPDATQQSAPAPAPPTPASESPWAVPLPIALALVALVFAAALIAQSRVRHRRKKAAVAVEDEPPPAELDDSAPVVGYLTVSRDEAQAGAPHAASAALGTLCEERGWPLVKVVHDVDPASDRITDHPGLFHVLQQISGGAAEGIVVPRLRDLTGAASDLGGLLKWLDDSDAFLVALDLSLDTREPSGRLAARALAEVSEWERRRIADRTRSGLAAARSRSAGGGRPSVRDDPELSDRIRTMRAEGMSLQAIADRLNREGVPTLRGGRKWRPSSVQAAAGYKRPVHRTNGGALPPVRRQNGQNGGSG
jgi:DNA invertase Pin-like site-specific DNA recombinase/peptidoglycan hydrolase-like protein with peptidoglycan-binding domain